MNRLENSISTHIYPDEIDFIEKNCLELKFNVDLTNIEGIIPMYNGGIKESTDNTGIANYALFYGKYCIWAASRPNEVFRDYGNIKKRFIEVIEYIKREKDELYSLIK